MFGVKVSNGGENDMEEFLMFYAPFIVVMLSLAAAFWLGPKDGAVSEGKKK